MAIKIILTKGFEAIIDDCDFNIVSQFKWHVSYSSSSKLYARRTFRVKGKVYHIYLHRFILNASKGIEVDHINGNGLDCRRINLRVCIRTQNMANRNNLGISWHKLKRGKGYWRARIKFNGKNIHIGLFENKEEAIQKYREYQNKFFGEFSFKGGVLP